MQLFAYSDIASEFRARWSRSERDLAKLDEAALSAGDAVREIKQRESSADVPRLHRTAATFPLETKGEKTVANVIVPFTGVANWFYVIVPNSGYTTVDAEIRSGPYWGEGSSPEDAVIFTRVYTSAPTASDIREWAVHLVDEVEGRLQTLRPLVDTQVAALNRKIDDYAASRLTSLANKRSLQDGLGTGI